MTENDTGIPPDDLLMAYAKALQAATMLVGKLGSVMDQIPDETQGDLEHFMTKVVERAKAVARVLNRDHFRMELNQGWPPEDGEEASNG